MVPTHQLPLHHIPIRLLEQYEILVEDVLAPHRNIELRRRYDSLYD